MSKTIVCVVVIIGLLYLLNAPESSWSKYGKSSKMLGNGDITIMWFYRPGCPHCDNIENDWIKLTQSNLPKKYKLVSVDTTLTKNKLLASKYGVNGVPHIVKSLSNGYYKVYNGNRSLKHMRKWILFNN